MAQRVTWISLAIVLALAATGAATRLALRDIPNFAPIAALALFTGYLVPQRRYAALAPLGALALSDLVIGGYDLRLMSVVYAALVSPMFIGHWLRERLPVERGWSALGATSGLVGTSLASSAFFFVTTNFAVWALGTSYERSWSGLLHCYERALPFFRYTLAGDLLFAVVLFTGYALFQVVVAGRSHRIPASASSP